MCTSSKQLISLLFAGFLIMTTTSFSGNNSSEVPDDERDTDSVESEAKYRTATFGLG